MLQWAYLYLYLLCKELCFLLLSPPGEPLSSVWVLPWACLLSGLGHWGHAAGGGGGGVCADGYPVAWGRWPYVQVLNHLSAHLCGKPPEDDVLFS